jgi:hypothetical protein
VHPGICNPNAVPYGGGSKAAREVFLHISFYPTYQTAAPKTAPFVPEKIKGGSVFEVGTKVGTIGEEKTLKPCGFKVFYGTLHQKRYFAFFCYREHFLLHKPGVKMMTRGLFHFSGNLIE